MAELDKVIKGLEHCKEGAKGCTNCEYADPYNACSWKLMEDAMELLKEYKQLRIWAWHAVKEQDIYGT